jgi:hypothetical protein
LPLNYSDDPGVTENLLQGWVEVGQGVLDSALHQMGGGFCMCRGKADGCTGCTEPTRRDRTRLNLGDTRTVSDSLLTTPFSLVFCAVFCWYLVECVSHGRCCGVVVDCVRRIQCMNPSDTVDHITNSERKDAKKASSIAAICTGKCGGACQEIDRLTKVKVGQNCTHSTAHTVHTVHTVRATHNCGYLPLHYSDDPFFVLTAGHNAV